MSERRNGVDCSAVNILLANSSGDKACRSEQTKLLASKERFSYPVLTVADGMILQSDTWGTDSDARGKHQ
jgi:hypothetical protein